MLSNERPRKRREPIWSRWDAICAISLVAACVLVSLTLPLVGISTSGH